MHYVTAAAVCALLAAAPVRAQEAAADTTPRTSLQKGAWSLSFDVPAYGANAGSGSFGGWKMVGERTNLGLVVGIHVYDRDDSTSALDYDQESSSLSVGLHTRRYVGTIRDVTPFLAAGIDTYAGRSSNRQGSTSVESQVYGASAQGGVGVEWFPVRRISLAGHTGAQVRVFKSDDEVQTDTGPRGGNQRTLDVATFTSRLSLQIYF
ncbi:MAG TPA: hypothetical protein VGB24_18425 [Longimicrobium sp.]|jgi:hypothetical protein|uniref:hypothetical protein n=1 Tax=Longimicrobium sp. TaxID=2029185 RepID=UPI002EDA4D74